MSRRRQASPVRKAEQRSGAVPVLPRLVIAVLAGVLAAWSAAGAIGLQAHALRHAITWVALGITLVAGWPGTRPTAWSWVGLLLALAGSIAATATPDRTVNVLAVPLMLGWLAAQRKNETQPVFGAAALASALYAVYTLLRSSVPAVWLLADRLGHWAGAAVGRVVGRPLNVGATFAGLDMAVLMLALLGAWLLLTRPPRLARALYGLAAIAAAQLAYLIMLAFAADWVAMLPKPDPATADALWLSALRWTVPWQLPLAAAVLQGIVIAGMLRWGDWSAEPVETPAGRRGFMEVTVVAALAAALGLCTTLCLAKPALAGKKIVIYKEGYLNWLKPQHEDYGRLSIGMYGMLPPFIRGLGASCVVSPDLSAADLQGADLLMLIYPDKKWEAGQLERIHDFVKAGGSLWLFGEHTVREKEEEGDGARFNDVLVPTAMRVQFDSATFAVGGWLHSYDALAHPATLGVPDDRNQFGIVIGASLAAAWPARPVIVGRWGWSDGGDPGHSSMMGNDRYDAGEKLGDVILAAEQRVGKGRIVAFGDPSGISNGINIAGHDFTGRMLAYLTGAMSGPQDAWRGVVAAVLAVALLWMLARRPVSTVCVAAAVLALTRFACTEAAAHRMTTNPASDPEGGNDLAYIDAGHLNAFSGESWRDDGLMGLCLNLMRNGYLTLMTQDLTPQRLAPARLLIAVAPGRAYSSAERAAVRTFVGKGGTLIVTCGEDEKDPCAPLLADFGLEVGDGTYAAGPTPGPMPRGFFKSPYYDVGDYRVFVRFYAGWPVHSMEKDARVLAYGTGDLPIILMRRVGQGKVILVGDTCFAMNKNLEVESGIAFEGMRENPHFWRWLLTNVRDQPLWIPPNPKAAQGDAVHEHEAAGEGP